MVFYKNVDNTFILTRKVDSSEHLQNLKNILQRNIKPEYQSKFVSNYKIEIYNLGQLSGVLLIGSENVNFINNKLAFGFKLTYGIGMSLN